MEENTYMTKEVINAPKSYKDKSNNVIYTLYNLTDERTEQSYPYTLLDDFPQYRTFYMDVDSTLEITLDSNFQMEQVYVTPGNSDARNVFNGFPTDIEQSSYKKTIVLNTKFQGMPTSEKKTDDGEVLKNYCLSDNSIIYVTVNNNLKIPLRIIVYEKSS